MLSDIDVLHSNVADIHHRFGSDHLADRRFRIRTIRLTPTILGEGGRRVMCRHKVQGLPIEAVDIAKLGVADTGGVLQH